MKQIIGIRDQKHNLRNQQLLELLTASKQLFVLWSIQPMNKLKYIIKKIISDRLQDDQFSECDLTLKELETVAKALYESLKGIFHSRIEYPEIKKQKVNQA